MILCLKNRLKISDEFKIIPGTMMKIDKIFHSDCFFCSPFLCVKEKGEE